MLSLRKISQDISEPTCKWIPMVPLNQEWNDKKIYEYFQLSEDEIKLIKETKIIGFHDVQPIQNMTIITNKRKQYYLIGYKLYKIKKDKSKGELYGTFIDGQIKEIKEIKELDEFTVSKNINTEKLNINTNIK